MKPIACWKELNRWISLPLSEVLCKQFMEVWTSMPIIVKISWTFEPEYSMYRLDGFTYFILNHRHYFFHSYKHNYLSKRHSCLTCSVMGYLLTPSRPQPLKFAGWKIYGRACKQYIFRSYSTSTFGATRFDKKKYFHRPVRKRRQKGFKVSNFALLWVVFNWHHGGEGVKTTLLGVGRVASRMY